MNGYRYAFVLEKMVKIRQVPQDTVCMITFVRVQM